MSKYKFKTSTPREVRNTLSTLVNLVANDEIENIDKNVYRKLLRYTAGVYTATEKIIRRK